MGGTPPTPHFGDKIGEEANFLDIQNSGSLGYFSSIFVPTDVLNRQFHAPSHSADKWTYHILFWRQVFLVIYIQNLKSYT